MADGPRSGLSPRASSASSGSNCVVAWREWQPAALAGEAEVVIGHARDAIPARVDAALLFDVLHMMRLDEQEALMAALASALDADGV